MGKTFPFIKNLVFKLFVIVWTLCLKIILKQVFFMFIVRTVKEETLSSDIIKLQDPDYIARFAREKYLYSRNGEIIIKIVE